MAGTSATFKIVDLSRAIKGVEKGGMKVGRAEIDPATGRIVLFAASSDPEPQNDLDEWKARRHARKS